MSKLYQALAQSCPEAGFDISYVGFWWFATELLVRNIVLYETFRKCCRNGMTTVQYTSYYYILRTVYNVKFLHSQVR
jgi:hypothetical protein